MRGVGAWDLTATYSVRRCERLADQRRLGLGRVRSLHSHGRLPVARFAHRGQRTLHLSRDRQKLSKRPEARRTSR